MSLAEGVVPAVRLVAGRYQIGELIGRGGMADVYLGTDARLGRKVAIKLLKPTLANDPAFRVRFRREAQDAAKMAHPTIVRIFDAGEETITDASGHETQQPFIIMEYVDGQLLKDVIAEGPMDSAKAVRVIEQVLTALEYSHRAGVVHRDIKPGNIMLTASNQVKVMDFGIARAISDSSATIAETSVIVGTAQYFSPEQARGEAVDARTDLYSTGIVFFEMLTGKAPFVGDNPVAVAYQHVNQTPVPPSSINPKVSPAIDAVVLRSMAKDRFERFQSAAEFREDVELAAVGEVRNHKLPGGAQDFNATLFGVNPTVTAGSEAAMRQLSVDSSARSARTQNRPPVAWIWAGIAFMVVIIAAVTFWTLNLKQTVLTDKVSISVSDVTGTTWESGLATLTDENLNPQRFTEVNEDIPAEQIIRTDPEAGTRVSPGQLIKVYVSSGPQPIAVTDVRGLAEADARAALLAAEFVDGILTTENSPTVAAGIVIRTDPSAGSAVKKGSTINIVTSTGLVTVPTVVGLTASEASSALQALLLQVSVTTNSGCSGGKVDQQSLPPGDQPQGSKVTIRVCAG